MEKSDYFHLVRKVINMYPLNVHFRKVLSTEIIGRQYGQRCVDTPNTMKKIFKLIFPRLEVLYPLKDNKYSVCESNNSISTIFFLFCKAEV